MKTNLLFQILAFVLLVSLNAGAQHYTPDDGILYVKKGGSGNQSGSSWDHAIPELADALKWAHENKADWTTENPLQIWVAKGIYKPKYSPADDNFGNPAGYRNSFLLVKDVMLYGGFDPDNSISDLTHTRDIPSFSREAPNGTILSGDLDDSGDHTEGDARHLVIAAGEVGSALLDGFTIRGGYIGWPDENATQITVNSTTVTPYTGAGINVSYSSPTLSHIHVNQNRGYLNSSSSGKTLQGMGIFMLFSSSVLSHCRISNNTIYGNVSMSGAGMYLYYSPATLTNLVIYDNSIPQNEFGAPASGGGGIFAQNSTAVLKNVVIRDNSVTSSVASGGGLANSSSGIKLINALVVGNSVTATQASSSHNNGATGGGINNNAAVPTLINVTIAGNTVSAPNSPGHLNSGGGGIFYFNSHSDLHIHNSVIWGNKKGNGAADNLKYDNRYPQFKNSILQANEGIGGQIGSDPLFSDPAGGDYTLSDGSPAINTGDNELYTNAGGNLAEDKDAAGNPRLYETNIDIGAYEHGAALPVTLIAFNAAPVENMTLLTWQTAEEVNTSHFEIQRSPDGENFAAIGNVPSKGEGKGKERYAFTDTQASRHIWYYRLKIVDIDGSYAFSPIVSIQNSSANEIAGATLYPNPVAGGKVTLLTPGGWEPSGYQVLNALGRRVEVPFSGGELDTVNLAPGLYLVQVLRPDGSPFFLKLLKK